MARQETTSTLTLKEIASHCGVTKGTVSRALRGDLSHVGTETVKRIRAAALELGYNPGSNHDARRLALRKGNQPIINNTIGLILMDEFCYDANYYMTLFNSVLNVLAPKHFGLLLTHVYPDTRTEDLPYAFRRDEVDGFMTCSENFDPSILDELRRHCNFARRPIVSMIYRLPGCAAVVPDHQMAGYLLARHLLSLGHRHVLHFADGDVMPQHPLGLRLAGYRQAYQELSLDPDVYLHRAPFPYDKSMRKSDLYLHTGEVLGELAERPEVTAVLAPYDEYAGALIEMLAKQGVRVPEEMSVVGLDDTDPVPNERGENILTTVQMPLQEIGRQAAALMLRRISGEETEDITVMLPVRLIERASTCPPGPERLR